MAPMRFEKYVIFYSVALEITLKNPISTVLEVKKQHIILLPSPESYVGLSACLPVCLSVSKITQKVIYGI